MIEITDGWKKAYPGAVIGVLVMRGARTCARHKELDRVREKIESELRERYSAAGKEGLKTDPVMAAYEGYYRRFKKSYHVALQLESVIWKGRQIPSVISPVQAMFMAELKNKLLTAGHDLARVVPPLVVGTASGLERYTNLGGEERSPKEGDMTISDAHGLLFCIIYGPEKGSPITAETRDLLFTVYAPAGIGEERVRAHLEDIEGFIRIVAPETSTERMETCCAAQPSALTG